MVIRAHRRTVENTVIATMLRTTIYLDEEVALAIRQLADREQRSQAEIIREALRRYLPKSITLFASFWESTPSWTSSAASLRGRTHLKR
jgi:Ribbon-helix-helix protein, copG family